MRAARGRPMRQRVWGGRTAGELAKQKGEAKADKEKADKDETSAS